MGAGGNLRHIYGAAGTPERGTAQDSKTTCRRLFGGSGEESDNLASAEETGTGKSSEMGQSAPQVMSSAPAAQEVLKIYVSTLGEATPQGLQSTAVRPKNNAGKRVHGARESTPGKDMVEGALPFSLESSFGRKSVLSSLRPAELNVRRATPQQQQRRDAEQTFRRRPGRSGTRMAAMRG